MRNHTLPIRIYYEDTDAGGIVYHANYLKFAERGRTEFLRAAGFSNQAIEQERGIIFVVRHIGIDYIKPAFLDDLLQMKTSVEELKNSSFIMRQKLYKDDALIADLKVVLVCVDSKKYIPTRLPKDIKESFQLV